MKITCSKNDLIEACQALSKAIANKAPTPIISGIYMKAEGSTLELQANNFEIGVIAKIPVNTEIPGEIVVTGKYLQEIIKKLSGEVVSISEEENHTITIQSETASFKLLCMSAEDFPKVKSPEIYASFKMKKKVLKNLIRKTAYACASDDARPIFTGCYLDITGNDVTMAATNTHRIAVIKETVDESIDNISLVIPSKSLWEVSRLIDSSNESTDVFIECSRKNVSFTFDNIYFTSRLIDGQFPPYDKVIPKTSTTVATVNVAEMLDAVDRVALISKENEYKTIRFMFSQGSINISSDSPDVGKAEENISAVVEGPDLDISFNVIYIIDILRAADTDEVVIKLNQHLSPVDIREKDNDNFIYIVTPVRTN